MREETESKRGPARAMRREGEGEGGEGGSASARSGAKKTTYCILIYCTTDCPYEI